MGFLKLKLHAAWRFDWVFVRHGADVSSNSGLAVCRLRGLLDPLEGRHAQSVGNNTGADPQGYVG
jgi:hypothetical protein